MQTLEAKRVYEPSFVPEVQRPELIAIVDDDSGIQLELFVPEESGDAISRQLLGCYFVG